MRPRFLLSTTPPRSRLSHMATIGRATTARLRRPQQAFAGAIAGRFHLPPQRVVGRQPHGRRRQRLRGNVDRPQADVLARAELDLLEGHGLPAHVDFAVGQQRLRRTRRRARVRSLA